MPDVQFHCIQDSCMVALLSQYLRILCSSIFNYYRHLIDPIFYMRIAIYLQLGPGLEAMNLGSVLLPVQDAEVPEGSPCTALGWGATEVRVSNKVPCPYFHEICLHMRKILMLGCTRQKDLLQPNLSTLYLVHTMY